MKTKKYIKIFGLLGLLCAGSVLSGCNSDPNYSYELPSSALITSFNLAEDEKVLNNLDSVFFSIDLYTGEIFNADSLPYGTDISALTPVINTESASEVEVTGFVSTGEEKTYNYLDNTTDTLDFSQPVTIKVVSYNKNFSKSYSVKVNVHRVPTDTLIWSRIEGGGLPTKLNAVEKQHTTVSPGATYYCLTANTGQYCIAYTSDPSGAWQVGDATMTFAPNINTFTATNDALYILSEAGRLYSSADNGLSWTEADEDADFILGAYGNRLLTTKQTADGWYINEYPAAKSYPAPADFPVLNASNSTTVTFEMSISAQLILTGGRMNNGELTSATWGFDGTSWVKISRNGMPLKAENMALVPYFDVHADTISWRVSQPTSVLMAMCGNLADGTPNDTIYMTRNFGITWSKAPGAMQMPKNIISPRTYAQAFPYTATMTDGDTSALSNIKRLGVHTIDWKELLDATPHKANIKSRATQPVTEWEVPYIYLFGGEDATGTTFNTVYRGVITALKFKPLQ